MPRFLFFSKPICDKRFEKFWPPVTANEIIYENIEIPGEYTPMKLTNEMIRMIELYDSIYDNVLHQN